DTDLSVIETPFFCLYIFILSYQNFMRDIIITYHHSGNDKPILCELLNPKFKKSDVYFAALIFMFVLYNPDQ
ncbi:5425_t:CDS:1, partial [Cetraspora pellucida]